jgi:bifunctional enzyme CysN/CysC
MALTGIATEQLKIVIVGHVDHGKSTFVGRLFHDTGSLPDGKLEELQRIAQRRCVPFEWANLMDSLQVERNQNITVDTTQIWFRTPKRQYVLIDAPGHKEFLKNMVTGAASAEAALLLIDANEGVQEQSRRHGYLLNLLGIRQLVVLVNKMDLKNYSQACFRQIEAEYRAFLVGLGIEPKCFLPISAKQGDNIARRGDNMPWWSGPTVLETIDEFQTAEPPTNQPLRLVVQDVYRFDHRRILAGRVEAGILKVGDRLLFNPAGKTSTVKTIERWSAPEMHRVGPGEAAGITLTEQIFVERGAIATHEDNPPYVLTRFKVRLFWLGRTPFQASRAYKLKLATQETECQIDAIDRIVNSSTLEVVCRTESRVERNEAAELTLRTKRPVAFDTHAEVAATGRFVLVDGSEVAGGGVIVADNYPRRSSDALQKSHNIYWYESKITTAQRAAHNGHSGRIVWLTGLSSSGKSSIAAELERELFLHGRHTYVLDGDNVRHGLCSDLGFSLKDRAENIRRVGEVAKLFADAGTICITAFISPSRSDREMVRRMMKKDQFIEVFVNAPIAVCEQRDAKGLYAKARKGEIKDFTGVSAPYEPPLAPEIELHTDQMTVTESVTKIIEHLQNLEHP